MRELLINVAASAIFFLIGLATQQLVIRIRRRLSEPFWHGFGREESILVIGRMVGDAFDAYEPPGVIGIGDVRGLHELTKLFKTSHLKPFEIGYANELTPDQLKQNLIVLGGGDVNSITKSLMSEVGSHIEFLNETTDPADPPALVDTRPSKPKTYKPNKVDGSVVLDYGVIVRAHNPRNQDRWIVIIAGCLGYATWSGVSVTRRRELKHASSDFELIYETDVTDNKPRKSEPVWGWRPIGGNVTQTWAGSDGRG